MEKQKEKTIKELLQLMLDSQQHFQSGLCNWIDNLYVYNVITSFEFSKLKNYIRCNKPNLLHNIIYSNGSYWWRYGDIFPRIEWVKKHIKKNS